MSPAPSSAAPDASSRPDDAPLPRSFGRYQLFDRIGRGGMADIFLARTRTELGADRLVVVKQIDAAFSRDEVFARMFVEEAKLCAGLRHTNVVQVLDLGREEGSLYMAMEYVEGFDLHQLLARSSRAKIGLPTEFAMFLVREVLTALDFAHRAHDGDGRPLGIVHRDVSPSNVLMSLEGEVKLCDFGIARAAGRATQEDSGAPRVVGKSAYMSPEQARGETIDARADVFAAGILLWELCAGRRLYRGTEDEMLALAQRAEIPPLCDRPLPELPQLQAILDRALAPAPSDRFVSAAEFLVALDDYSMQARLFASQIRFGAFLSERFGADLLVERRARERAARALELGPPVSIARLEDVDGDDDVTIAQHTVAPDVASRASDDATTIDVRSTASLSEVTTGHLRALPEGDTSPSTVVIPIPPRRDIGAKLAVAVLGVIVLGSIALAAVLAS